jgi:hypothetical protein
MRTWRWYSKVLFALLVASFAYYVWPTPWRYLPSAGREDVRVHRVTGRIQGLSHLGWQDMKADTESPAEIKARWRADRQAREPSSRAGTTEK